MIPMFKKNGAVIIYIITAVGIFASAYLLKGTPYKNVWLYILAVGIVLSSVFEFYSRIKNKKKR